MPHMRDLEYQDFRRSLQERAARPLHAEFELTHRCNLSCIHCYLGSQRGKDGELTTRGVMSILDKLQEAGFIWLVLTGGEPLLRPDFPEIYRYAKERGFIIIILTNATLIDESIAGLFAMHKPFYLDISMHGAETGIYERIAGVAGSFGRFMRALDLLREKKIPFKLKTKAMKENAAGLGEIGAFASKLGVPHRTSDLVHPCLDGDPAPVEHRLDSYAQAGSFRCAAVNFSVCVDPMGQLMACEGLREPSYDLMSGNLGEGLEFLRRYVSKQECIIR
jgi:sulfatase maturation enzyme AslB (radical SAM superfamily)